MKSSGYEYFINDMRTRYWPDASHEVANGIPKTLLNFNVSSFEKFEHGVNIEEHDWENWRKSFRDFLSFSPWLSGIRNLEEWKNVVSNNLDPLFGLPFIATKDNFKENAQSKILITDLISFTDNKYNKIISQYNVSVR